MRVLIAAFIAALCITVVSASASERRPTGLPADAVKLSPCIPGMGEHWGNPKNFPHGPLYGVADGKIVFTEVMLDQKAFAAGKSWDETLEPIAGHAIDHVDIDFNPHGHPGWTIPHYDIHAYYVKHAEHLSFCASEK